MYAIPNLLYLRLHLRAVASMTDMDPMGLIPRPGDFPVSGPRCEIFLKMVSLCIGRSLLWVRFAVMIPPRHRILALMSMHLNKILVVADISISPAAPTTDGSYPIKRNVSAAIITADGMCSKKKEMCRLGAR